MNRLSSSLLSVLLFVAMLALVGGAVGTYVWLASEPPREPVRFSLDHTPDIPETDAQTPRLLDHGNLIAWWDPLPADLKEMSQLTGTDSNIHPEDYAGPESCRKCHKKNYADWAEHPHRWMNAIATDEIVKGDFDANLSIDFMGGQATFLRLDGKPHMKLQRDGITRLFDVRQTIGSRFFQYYIGQLVDGPVPEGHPAVDTNVLLPFGYWLEPGEWVPTVHIENRGEPPDEDRVDPFTLDTSDAMPYTTSCAPCHTTFPLGDDLCRKPDILSRQLTDRLHWGTGAYLASEHSELLLGARDPSELMSPQINEVTGSFYVREAEAHAVTLGISCEACHLGCKAHAEGKEKRPAFAPQSPYLRRETPGEFDSGRTHGNVNRVCSRCHSGGRPEFATGAATWNSVEYDDAMKGHCYSQLRCVDCHNPHKATGPRWTKTPEQDDQSCIRCHDQYSTPEAVTAHTHHPVGSAGSRCMNCHMPRINEGLQAVVRTHVILSPTDPRMIEENHPNACNLCHVDESIRWTLTHLKDWYDHEYDRGQISLNYVDQEMGVAHGWLSSDNEAVRLIGADALARTGDRKVLPDLIGALDDQFLINRQFARMGIERMLDRPLESFGYRFYMMQDERREPLQRIREFVNETLTQDSPPQ